MLPAFSQEFYISKDEAIENLLNYISENDEQSIDFDEFSTQLSQLYDHPIDLNTCKDEDLATLNVFSAIQIMNIIDYRKRNMGFTTLYELKLVDGISREQIFLAIPFLKVDDKEKYSPEINLKNLSRLGKHSLLLRYQRVLEKQAAYIPDENGETKFLGSADRIYSKYKFQFTNKIRAGITADKDAGEPFFKSPNQQGFDFFSGFVQLQNQGVIKSLVIGDFSLQFGQGLAVWNGFGMGKSTMTTNVSKFGKGVDKYSSTDENNFFRGLATTLDYKNFELSVFGSYKHIDGNTDVDNVDNDIDYFSSFDQTGLHATSSDFEDKNTILQKAFGGDLSYRFERLKIGASFIHYDYSHNLQASDKLYKLYDFSGNENNNASFHYQWNLNHIFLSGEVAVDDQLNWAVTNNASFNISSKLGLAVLHRYFEKDYHAQFSAAFAEGSRAQNEQGFYTGINLLPTKNWIISAYIDLYEFLWLKYQVSSPSQGLDYFINAEYALSSNFNFYFRYKKESKPKDFAGDNDYIKQQIPETKQQLRAHFNYGDRNQFHFKTRLEWSWYEHETKENGMLVYQDIIYDLKKLPIKSTIRFLVYDTDGYDSRIYTYENDLLYNYAIPAFSGRGIRSYFLINYKLMKNLNLWVKYGITIYEDEDTVGSSDTEIQGNKKSEIKIQLQWKF